MKIKSLLCAAMMATTCIAIPINVYAETTYATPNDLITEAIEIALTGVESTTYDNAIANMQSLITVSGDEVFYDGTSIGYWYSNTSDTIYADDTKTDTILSNKGVDIWEFEPTVLENIITDINNDLIETLVPTTEDWSKIIGKYDITLGDITIPADQWFEHTKGIGFDGGITVAENLSDKIGLTGHDLGELYNDDCLYISIYGTKDGKLYIYDTLYALGNNNGSWMMSYDSIASGAALGTATRSTPINNCPIIHGAMHTATGFMPLRSNIRVTDVTKTTVASDEMVFTNGANINLYDVYDASVTYNQAVTTLDDVGWFWFTGDQISNTTIDSTTLHAEHLDWFTIDPQSSKQQIGNTILKKRLSKFSALTAGDTIEVTPTAWTVYGFNGSIDDFDNYLGDQSLMNPGDTADIAAVADIEPLAFKVVTPTSLPIYVDSEGITSVASNATIENKSNASVIMTDVNIEAKADTGWTLVNVNPSNKRDANEFTFTTSLVPNTVLAKDEILPFTYQAQLSPVTDGIEQLDLATVLVTVDWEDT